MIAHLTGKVARLESNSVVLDVQGVGYRVYVPLGVLSNLPVIGEQATLYTTLSVSSNTFEFTLYGFASHEEQQVFLLLTSVTGVGARVALSMLSVYYAAELARIVSTNDVKSLTKVPGVGPKLAQRVALELGEKMSEYIYNSRIETFKNEATPVDNETFEDVVEALVNLGYTRQDAKKAAERVISVAVDKKALPQLIREALNLLSNSGVR